MSGCYRWCDNIVLTQWHNQLLLGQHSWHWGKMFTCVTSLMTAAGTTFTIYPVHIHCKCLLPIVHCPQNMGMHYLRSYIEIVMFILQLLCILLRKEWVCVVSLCRSAFKNNTVGPTMQRVQELHSPTHTHSSWKLTLIFMHLCYTHSLITTSEVYFCELHPLLQISTGSSWNLNSTAVTLTLLLLLPISFDSSIAFSLTTNSDTTWM